MKIYFSLRKFFETTFCFLFLLVITSFLLGQDSISSAKENKVVYYPNEIIKKAKNSISKTQNIDDIKAIQLDFESIKFRPTNDDKVSQSLCETKISFGSVNQIKVEEFTDFTTNQHLFTEIYNAPLYSINSDVLINGKPFYFGSNLGAITPKLTKEDRITSIQQQLFNFIFPIIFQLSWFQGVEVKYIGEAESTDFRANILELTFKNKSSRLFFDKESNLPVLMTQTFTHPTTKKEIERKTYFTDYRETNGLLVAHKITIQTGNNTTEERQLKKLEINPKFKPNLFEIKEDKINPY